MTSKNSPFRIFATPPLLWFGPICVATFKIKSDSPKGKINFIIKDYKDVNNRIGNEIKTTTDSSEVIVK